jgi:hypothetical protein
MYSQDLDVQLAIDMLWITKGTPSSSHWTAGMGMTLMSRRGSLTSKSEISLCCPILEEEHTCLPRFPKEYASVLIGRPSSYWQLVTCKDFLFHEEKGNLL